MATINNSSIETFDDGENWDSPTSKSPFTLLSLIQCLVGVVGIFGNSLVCFVFLHRRTQRSQINLLVTNQAFVDLVSSTLVLLHNVHSLSSLYIPTTKFWAILWCYLWKSQLLLFGSFAISTFNLTVISLERYVATVHPMSYSSLFRRRNVRLLIAAIWIIAPFMQYLIVGTTFSFVNGSCVIQWSPAVVGVILFLWEYFLPVMIMTCSFFSIVKKFRSMNKILQRGPEPYHQDDTNLGNHLSTNLPLTGSALPSSTEIRITQNRFTSSSSTSATEQAKIQQRNVKRRNATTTLMVVYVVYIVCWSPNQWAFFQYNLGGQLNFWGSFYQFATILAICNSSINPFIYALRHKTYKERLATLLRNLADRF